MGARKGGVGLAEGRRRSSETPGPVSRTGCAAHFPIPTPVVSVPAVEAAAAFTATIGKIGQAVRPPPVKPRATIDQAYMPFLILNIAVRRPDGSTVAHNILPVSSAWGSYGEKQGLATRPRNFQIRGHGNEDNKRRGERLRGGGKGCSKLYKSII